MSFPISVSRSSMKAPLAAASLLLSAAAAAWAQAPSLMSYQGRVSDSAGVLLGSAAPVNRTVTFKFYSAATGGTPVYAEAQTVTISGGDFSVLLGNGTGVSGLRGPAAPAATPYITLPSVMTGNVYLGVTVDDGTAAADPEITPRQQIVSAVYAFRAKTAETLLDGALSTAMLANSSVTTDKIGGAQITNAKLASDAVNTANIVSGSISDAKLANGSVTNGKLGAGAVTGDKIADNAITSAKLTDGSVTGADILDGGVAGVDIADGQVGTHDLANNAVSAGKIADNAVEYTKLVEAVRQSLCPAGTIMAFAGDTAPSGWVLCNGTPLNRTTYATLYNVVGVRFGSTAGDNFLVPDFRGRFLRGRDAGATRDEDRASRFAMGTGGAVGDAVGSVQDDNLRAHTHTERYIVPVTTGYPDGWNDRTTNVAYWWGTPTYTTANSGSAGGSETRPENASVNYIIKF